MAPMRRRRAVTAATADGYSAAAATARPARRASPAVTAGQPDCGGNGGAGAPAAAGNGGDRRDRRSGRRFRAGRQRGRRRRGWVTGWQLRHPGQYGPARHPGRRRIVVAVRREHHARRTARTRTAATVSARGAADPGILRGPRRWCRRPHGHAGRRTRAGTPSVALLHRLLCADSQLPHINGPRREVTVVSLIPNTE